VIKTSLSAELDTLALRVKQACFEDGLADIFMGGILLLLAFALFAVRVSIVFVIFFIVFVNPLFLSRILQAAKERWVYPRVGYVKPKEFQETNQRNSLLALALILSIIFVPLIALVALYNFTGLVTWLVWIAPVSLGVLLAIGPFIAARKYRLKRYYLFAILLPLIGFVIPWLNLSFVSIYVALLTTLVIEFTIVGTLALLSGAVLFLRFIRRYPVESTDLIQGDNDNAFL
jgi:hypothetical protein